LPPVYVLPAGEEHKNLDEIAALYRFLIENHCDRSSFLVALGGGVVGDMTGFAAAK
ncbi:MAG: 3-dehydroquinate synthase, partial [Bacteroidales bacterium]|nr:3-dehydroquinate synthase [Bacteroidales bacterium]